MTRGILAVDLGLRTGLARFSADNRLSWFRSHHFANTTALKRAVYGIVRDAEPYLVVVEGDRGYASIWEKAALKWGAEVSHPSPERWRADLLLPREQVSAEEAKAAARVLARRIIEDHGESRATELRTDTAEAICLGYWAMSRQSLTTLTSGSG
ncbi:MAG: hypothetical protein AAF735_03580 [Myxococcota bacterium]